VDLIHLTDRNGGEGFGRANKGVLSGNLMNCEEAIGLRNPAGARGGAPETVQKAKILVFVGPPDGVGEPCASESGSHECLQNEARKKFSLRVRVGRNGCERMWGNRPGVAHDARRLLSSNQKLVVRSPQRG